MLHRFTDSRARLGFHDVHELRETLELLRRRRFNILSVTDLVRSFEAGGPPKGHTVVFTVDDGYADFAALGAKVFADYDCPVTVFVASGFIDGEYWFWWDRVEFLFRETRRTTVEVRLGGASPTYVLRTPAQRALATQDLVQRLKLVHESEKEALLAALPAQSEVELPRTAPGEYAPMTWDDIRACRTRGASFGPHTVHHPILSQVSDDQVVTEVVGSRDRLIDELGQAGPVFCFPNGDGSSFGARESRVLAENGFQAALSALPDYVPLAPRDWPSLRWALPRFSCPITPGRVLALVTGLQRY